MRILLTFAWLLLAASLSAQPLRFTALTTNRTMVTFTNGEIPIWNSAAGQWSNAVPGGTFTNLTVVTQIVNSVVLTVSNFNAAHTFHLDWLYGDDATAKPDDMRFPWRTPTNWIAAQRTYINNGTNYLKGTGRPGRYNITNFNSTTGGPLWFSPTNVVWDLAGVEFFQTVTNECNTLILTNIDHFSIKGLTMRSTRQSGTTNDRSGLLHGGIAVAGRIKGWELDGVTMTNWTRHCITPLFGTINEGTSIRQCYFIKYGATNTVDLGFDGQAIPLIGNMQVEGCHFYDGTRGLETEGFASIGQNSGGATVRGCTFKRISESGVLIIPDFTPTAYFSVLVENNYFDGTGVDFPYAILARGGLRHRFLYNYITDYYTGIQLEADATFHLLTQVIGNQINFTDRPIVVSDIENEVEGVKFCDISRNVITTGLEFGMNLTISDSVISDNIIVDSGGDGLVLFGNTTANDPCVRNIVRGNLIGVNDEIVGDGIEIGASVRDIRLENNVIGAVNGVPLKKNGATNISELWHTITGVGIGTNAPTTMLQVAHTTKSSNVWDIANVKYWGAVGNGVADDTAAIQAAINNVTNAGGLVYIPKGDYNITTLIVGGSGVRIAGEASADGSVWGSQGSVLRVQGANYGIVIGDRTNDVQYNFTVENLSIVGTASGKAGIRVGMITTEPNNAVSRFLIANVTVSGFTGAAITHDVPTGEPGATGACGIFLPRGVTGRLKDVYCLGNYFGLLESSAHRATTVTFDSCSFRVNTVGLRLTSAVNFTFNDCVFESNNSVGFDAIGNSSLITFLSMNQSYFEGNGLVTATQDMRIANAYHISLRDVNINSISNGIAAAYLTNVQYGVMENVTQQATYQVNVLTTNCIGLLAHTRTPGANPVYSSNRFDFNGTTEVRTKSTGGQTIIANSTVLTISDTGNNYNQNNPQATLYFNGRWSSGTADPDADDFSDAAIKLFKDSADGSGGSGLSFHTSLTGAGGLSEHVRINKSGNVGFGTTTPLAPVHVVGGVAISNAQVSVGRVLTVTNANGMATWQDATGGSGTNLTAVVDGAGTSSAIGSLSATNTLILKPPVDSVGGSIMIANGTADDFRFLGNFWFNVTNNTLYIPSVLQSLNGLGADSVGSDIIIAGGQSTGTGRGGAIVQQTSTNTTTGSTVNGLQTRSYLAPKAVTLTDATATLVFNNALASGKWVSMKVFASTHATDGTDLQVVSEEFTIAAVNKAGTVTTTVSASAPSATQQSSGTLTTAWTAVANGNGIDVKNNANSSFGSPVITTQWRVEIDGNDANLITPQ